jgi:titin
MPGSAYGLVLGTGSGGSQVSSLVIRNFSIDGLVLGSNGNTIRDCYIGTDFFGTVKQANGNDGIRIDGSNNTIGGTTPNAANLISGNSRYGIHIDLTTAQGNQIQGNYIGTDSTGAADLGNSNNGIVVRGQFNTIGGNSAGARNIISGNDQFGVDIEGTLASNNFIQGNYIGTNAAGTTAIGNSYGGVLITDAPFNTIAEQLAPQAISSPATLGLASG